MSYFPPYFCSKKIVETIFKNITFLTKIISRRLRERSKFFQKVGKVQGGSKFQKFRKCKKYPPDVVSKVVLSGKT